MPQVDLLNHLEISESSFSSGQASQGSESKLSVCSSLWLLMCLGSVFFCYITVYLGLVDLKLIRVRFIWFICCFGVLPVSFGRVEGFWVALDVLQGEENLGHGLTAWVVLVYKLISTC